MAETEQHYSWPLYICFTGEVQQLDHWCSGAEQDFQYPSNTLDNRHYANLKPLDETVFENQLGYPYHRPRREPRSKCNIFESSIGRPDFLILKERPHQLVFLCAGLIIVHAVAQAIKIHLLPTYFFHIQICSID